MWRRRSCGGDRVRPLNGFRDRVALAQTRSLQFDAMGTVNDAVQNGIAEGWIAEQLWMPQRLTGESLRCAWLIRTTPFMASAFQSATDAQAGDRD